VRAGDKPVEPERVYPFGLFYKFFQVQASKAVNFDIHLRFVS
jgi:hypothetical protein